LSVNQEKIAQDVSRVLEKIYDYYVSSNDSLTEKAARFLSFSVILNSLLAGFSSVIFVLVKLSLATIVLNYLLYSAIALLVTAILLFLVSDIIASISLVPREIPMPLPENLDEMKVMHASLASPTEWYTKYAAELIETIKENKNLNAKLKRNVKFLTALITAASISLMGFIILILILASSGLPS